MVGVDEITFAMSIVIMWLDSIVNDDGQKLHTVRSRVAWECSTMEAQ